MIRKMVRQMLTAQIFSALTVSLCLLIDNIMIGRFLGVQAIAAYGYANPVLLVIGAFGTMLAAGVQVVCSRSLAQGAEDETNGGYSSALALTAVVSLALIAGVLIFRRPLATLMGAGSAGDVFDMTHEYMVGFIIGAPGSIGALVLVPFLQMSGQSTLLIVAVLGMTVADVALDLLNVLVFNGGMFGMGLASSLSYYVAMAVAAIYFLSKKNVFRFSLRLVTARRIRGLLVSGVPSVFNMAASIVLVFAMNYILRGAGGNNAVAAYSVLMTLANASNCISTGIGGVSLTLSGIFYNEEDRNALSELIRLLARYSVILGTAVGVLLLIFAPAMVGLFIPEPGSAQTMAALGLRIFAAGLIPCGMNNALKNMYQSTGRVLMTEIISLLEGAVLPALTAFLFSRFWGTTGAWLFFAVGECLTLGGICLYIRLKTGLIPWRDGNYLLLRGDFGIAAGNSREWTIRTLQDVSQCAQEAGRFCAGHGLSPKAANHIALCIEEAADNTVRYGIMKASKPCTLSVRVQHKADRWVLRFRDDCSAFDPVRYFSQEGQNSLGLRVIMALAEVRYTYTMSLNNLTLTFNGQNYASTLNR